MEFLFQFPEGITILTTSIETREYEIEEFNSLDNQKKIKFKDGYVLNIKKYDRGEQYYQIIVILESKLSKTDMDRLKGYSVRINTNK